MLYVAEQKHKKTVQMQNVIEIKTRDRGFVRGYF